MATWLWLHMWYQHCHSLNSNENNKNFILRGVISSIPDISAEKTVFLLDDGERLNRLVWRKAPPMHAGEEWQLSVKLFQPKGWINPGNIDYGKWLYSQHIGAIGFVLKGGNSYCITTHPNAYFLNRLRESICQSINALLPHDPMAPFLTALTVGVRNGITPDQWAILQNTGTNHLIAIAGLHIGFLASLIYAITSFFWRHPWLIQSLPRPLAACTTSLLGAWLYAALAGFSWPALRTVMMMSYASLCLFKRAPISLWQAYFLALFCVFILDPFVIDTVTVPLSFGSVAILLYALNYKMHKLGNFLSLLQVQWILTVGLIPLSILFFHQFSFSSLVANAIAVPVVGFTVLPLCMLGLITLKFKIGALCLNLASFIFNELWKILIYLSGIQALRVQAYFSSPWLILSSFVSVLLLISPKGFPGRVIGLGYLLPLVLVAPQTLNPGQLQVALFDLGKSQCAFVRTSHHDLMFNLGPKEIIDAYLGVRHIPSIDTLILTRAPKDEIINFPINRIYTSHIELFNHGSAEPCVVNTAWNWDNVNFKFLKNCDLLIQTPSKKILLCGPLNKAKEEELAQHKAELQRAFVITDAATRPSNTLLNLLNLLNAQEILFSTESLSAAWNGISKTIPLTTTAPHGMVEQIY